MRGSAKGHLQPGNTARTGGQVLWRERPLLSCGSVVERRCGGVVGIKEQTMPTAMPSMVDYAKAPWNKYFTTSFSPDPFPSGSFCMHSSVTVALVFQIT